MLLAADPAPAKVSVAIPGINAVNLAPGEGDLLTEVLVQRLQTRGLKVTTARDILAVLGLDRQKQLLGCGEESCVAELAAALGVDLLLVGDIGKLGAGYTLNFKFLSAKDSSNVARDTVTVPTSEVNSGLERVADSLVAQLATALHRPELIPTVSVTSPVRRWSWVPAALGVAAIGAGVGLQLAAQGQFATLHESQSIEIAQPAYDSGKALQTGGTVAFIAGGALIAAGAGMFLFGSDVVQPLAWATPSGGGVGLAGVLP